SSAGCSATASPPSFSGDNPKAATGSCNCSWWSPWDSSATALSEPCSLQSHPTSNDGSAGCHSSLLWNAKTLPGTVPCVDRRSRNKAANSHEEATRHAYFGRGCPVTERLRLAERLRSATIRPVVPHGRRHLVGQRARLVQEAAEG